VKAVLTLEAAKTPPDREAVLRSQGIPEHTEPRDRVLQLVDRALDLYAALTDPRAIYQELPQTEFEAIYHGEGLNEHPTPLEEIVPGAERLALFVVTLGDAVSREITGLFRTNDPALGYMLDAIASERADRAAELVGEHFLSRLVEDRSPQPATRVLAYSPGYCGWHITGQRKLFDFLRPEEIGVRLNASCLMQPLKSVSGVLVAGAREIHSFNNDYDFCDNCTTHQCRERIASLADGETARGRTGERGWTS
jgi:hypothetical protein